MINATCVLITKEKEYPQEILRALPDFDEFIVEENCPNIYRRYELAMQAKNDVIYVQDDDCIVNPVNLIFKYEDNLTNAMTEHHLNWYRDKGVTLVGFGTFFPKRMLLKIKPYLDRFGADKLLLREADRVFTYFNQPHNSIIMPIRNLNTATDSSRMSTQREHYESLDRIIDRLKTFFVV